MSCTITATEFKEYFDRGQFDYGTDIPSVRDKDIDSAIAESQAVFNGELYPDEESCKQAMLYLTAHFLTLDIDSADSGGQSSFVQTSRSANGVSESVHIPEWMKEGEFSFYATTYYGQKWLMISKPYLDGAVFSTPGATSP